MLFTLVASAGVAAGIPFLNAILFFIGLVALIIMAVRFGYWFALIASLSTIALCLFLYGPYVAAGCLILFIGPGLLMSRKARTFSKPYKILLWGMLPYLIPIIALIAFYPYLIAQTPTLVEEIRQQLVAGGGFWGLTGDNLNQAVMAAEKTFELVMRLTPGIFATMFAAIVLFGYLGATSMGARFGAIMPAFRPISLWRASELWLIPLGLSLVFLLVGGSIRPIGENLLVFLVHLYALYGICIIEFYFKKTLVMGWLRIILYLLVLTVAVVVIPVLAFLGLIDSRFDLRKMDVKKTSAS